MCIFGHRCRPFVNVLTIGIFCFERPNDTGLPSERFILSRQGTRENSLSILLLCSDVIKA
ncbi:hypothetical protein BMETH_900_1 [methanotrophic bacterial endosymbiont of Bathymodiolus sp.]|nr:hypothetical protein BMETH_900_1 [methanotrophic bacterial endosymbiont of Bathymodiolus sp.]